MKTDLSPCEPSSDAARDLPLDLSIKDETAIVTAVPTEQASVYGIEGDGERQAFNQDDCWSASSLIGSIFVDRSSSNSKLFHLEKHSKKQTV